MTQKDTAGIAFVGNEDGVQGKLEERGVLLFQH